MQSQSSIHQLPFTSLAAAMLGGLSLAEPAPAQSGGPYTLTWSSIDGGGRTTAAVGGAWALAGTIGQPDAGRVAGAPYNCVSGYWAAAAACPADFNGSGSVTVQDIFDFLAAYFTADLRADFNGSGAVSVQDVFDFLAAYFAGCAA